jgi:hypothetical protein
MEVNQMNFIPDDLFVQVSKIRHLNLAYNEIKIIPTTLSCANELEHLELSG